MWFWAHQSSLVLEMVLHLATAPSALELLSAPASST